MTTYIAIIQADGGGVYTASFPDFAECSAIAATLEGAIGKAREALLLHIEELLEARRAIAAPTSVQAIRRGDAVLLAAIEVPDDVGIEQVEVAVPALSLARVKSFADRQGLSLGALLVKAVDRWAMQEKGFPERGGGMPDGPTLFDFGSPPELRVDAAAAAFGPAQRVESHEDGEPGGTSEGITAELARLVDARPADPDITADRQSSAASARRSMRPGP